MSEVCGRFNDMTKQIQITMPDGSIWGMPAELVAQDRADHYGDKEGEESRKAEYAATLADNSELLDWAENNMNWNDVAHAAILIRPGSVDFQEGWVNGEKRVVESANTVGHIDWTNLPQAIKLPEPASGGSEIRDTFRGDNTLLRECIKTLIELNDSNSLVPHGIGGHTRTLLSASYHRLPNEKGQP